MNAPKPASDAESLARGIPSRFLKTAAAATRCLLWLVVVAWSLFVLTWGALHVWIVPRIGEWRPELERWASTQLGIAVKVGDIHADHGRAPRWLPQGFWGLMPTVALRDVRLFDPDGREALRLPLVQASLSPSSVWHRGFEQLLVEGPVLDVRRTPDGRIEVAGLDVASQPASDGSALDWFFSQPEFIIRQGTVRWTDELKGQPPLALSQVELAVRNHRRAHAFRLDASPPPESGERLSVRGRFREPLLELAPRAHGQMPWHDWQGELYAESARVDVSQLRAYVDLSRWQVELRAGRGALRAWADVENGAVRGVLADVSLQDVDATLGQGLPPLALETVAGRLDLRWDRHGFDLLTDGLRFRTLEGASWPGGQASLVHRETVAGEAARAGTRPGTRLRADHIDLAALAAIASRLPLSAELHRHLAELQPTGRVEGLTAAWGPAGEGAPEGLAYEAKGRVVGLSLAGKPSGRQSDHGSYPVPGQPGIRHADVDFDLNHRGGQARIAVRDGALEWPDVFEDPVLALDRLDARARWTVAAGGRIDVAIDDARVSNADVEGSASLRWHTADPATSSAKSRFPGVLDLNARLTRADATQVHRYLPLSVHADVRHYLREATLAGSSPRVDFRVRGDLWDVPFARGAASSGEFRVTAQLQGIDFDYVPAHLRDPGEPGWPALKGMGGQFVFDRDTLRITGLQGGAIALPGLRLSQGSFAVAQLMTDPTLEVASRVEGPADEILAIVRDSPLNGMTSGALAEASATGAASGQFELRIPLERLHATTVKGTVQLAGNDVHISPAAPVLAQAGGRVAFSEQGFAITGAQARAYGGEMRFEGGMRTDAQGAAQIRFEGQGTASAEGLRQGDLGIASELFAKASGDTAYRVQLGFRAGVPEITVSSSLQGMAVDLPAPLGKTADTAMPVRFEHLVQSVQDGGQGPQAATDRLQIDVGPASARVLSVQYERDITGAVPRVLRGGIALGLSGDEAVTVPAAGVQANLRLDELDVDAWAALLPSAGATAGQAGTAETATDPMAYLPTVAALRAGRVAQGGRTFHDVVIGGDREGDLWRANVSAREFDGYVEYRQPSGQFAGNIFARLARLELSQAATSEVEEILQQPSSLPALDLAVQDLVLNGRHLGRVEVAAVNAGGRSRVPEWRLNRLQVAVPEARLNATGNWAPAAGGARRAALSFHLDVRDAGQLLARFGREGVVRGGHGVIEGDIGWAGSPFRLDYPSLSGQLHAEVENGQFLQVEPGAAKLLGVLSLQALPRRLALDFRDVFSEGFSFDFIRGNAVVEQGVLTTNNLQMKGINAAVLMEGQADIGQETQDLKVVVVPEINAGTAALIATAINPAVGLGTFLAQFLLRQPLQSATTQHFHITGSWADPKVEKVAAPAPTPVPAQGP